MAAQQYLWSGSLGNVGESKVILGIFPKGYLICQEKISSLLLCLKMHKQVLIISLQSNDWLLL